MATHEKIELKSYENFEKSMEEGKQGVTRLQIKWKGGKRVLSWNSIRRITCAHRSQSSRNIERERERKTIRDTQRLEKISTQFIGLFQSLCTFTENIKRGPFNHA